MTSPGERRIGVRFDDRLWVAEVERLDIDSPARRAAETARRQLEGQGVQRSELRRCGSEGPDGTALSGRLKLYVPVDGGPASERPYGFVLSPATDASGDLIVRMVAFGVRHPHDPRVRSVYERAHKRLYGRYPGD